MTRNLQERLTLAQKLLGLAHMGFMPSPRLTREARLGLEEARQVGECMAPQAIEVLKTIENVGALPRQEMCKQGMKEVGAVLQPLLEQSNAEKQRERLSERQSAPAPRPGA